MVKVYYIMKMEKLNMMANILIINLMEMVRGIGLMVNIILDNGKTVKQKVRVFYIMKMEKLNMKVIL